MRFVKGTIPENAAFQPEANGWKYIKDIGLRWQVWISYPLAAPAAILLCWISGFHLSELTPTKFLFIWLGFWSLIPLHEYIHILFMPRPRSKDAVIIGYEEEEGVICAFYDGEQKKEELIISLAAPLFFISIMPAILLMMLGIHIPVLNGILILHAVGSGMDIYSILTILFQVPNGALVRSKGERSYWRTVQQASRLTAVSDI